MCEHVLTLSAFVVALDSRKLKVQVASHDPTLQLSLLW